MSDYELYDWSVPFRGQFVRAVLAYAGKTWTEGGDAAISDLMSGPVDDMPVPFMGHPCSSTKRQTSPSLRCRPSFFIWARLWASCRPTLPCAP